MGLLYIWMTCWCCFLLAEMKRVAAFDPMFLVSYTLPLFFMMYPFHQLVESSTVVVVSLSFSSIWFFRHVSKPNGQPLLKLGAVLLIESIYTLSVVCWRKGGGTVVTYNRIWWMSLDCLIHCWLFLVRLKYWYSQFGSKLFMVHIPILF